MACQYLSFADPLPHWDADLRPRTRSSTFTDVSYVDEQQQQQGDAPGGVTATGQARRRIGRPIAYTGDPDAQHLTEAERRRIKRRIANRESARRVRRKRQNALEDMQEKLEQVQGHATTLSARLQQAERERAALVRQLHDMHRRPGAAGEDAPAAAGQLEAGPLAPFNAAAAAATAADVKLERGFSAPDAGSPSRSAAAANNNNNAAGGGAVTTGSGPASGFVPQGGAMPWCGAVAEPPKPRQPMFVEVKPAASRTRVQCATGKPAPPPTAQQQPPPPQHGIPLLDLQSMPSADDPLDCFLRKPSHPLEDDAAVPLGTLEWHF